MTRHISGTTARKAGQAWEDALGNYHSYLAAQGLAVVHKTGPQVAFTKLRGKVGPVVTGPGPADYVGVLDDGRFVGFEAKSTSATSGYTLPAKSLHQLYWLDAIRRTSGGRAKAFYTSHGHRLRFFKSLEAQGQQRIEGIFMGSMCLAQTVKDGLFECGEVAVVFGI